MLTRFKSTMVLINLYALLLLCLAIGPIMAVTKTKSTPEVPEFFQDIEGDLSKVTWSHATNSIYKLNAAVMNEADVSMDTVTGGGSEQIQIMAHPPPIESYLSLQHFLNELVTTNINGKRKGIKLDFKASAAVPLALKILGEKSEQIYFPAWLNTDNERGPVNRKRASSDADQFLSECKNIFPQSTISIGWIKRFGVDAFPSNISGDYIMEMAEGMLKALSDNQISQPVRASLIARFEAVMLHLLKQTTNNTSTLWGPENDVVDVPALKQVVENGGIYMGITEQLEEMLSDSSSRLLFFTVCIAFAILKYMVYSWGFQKWLEKETGAGSHNFWSRTTHENEKLSLIGRRLAVQSRHTTNTQ